LPTAAAHRSRDIPRGVARLTEHPDGARPNCRRFDAKRAFCAERRVFSLRSIWDLYGSVLSPHSNLYANETITARPRRGRFMLDVILVAAGFGFFALAILYTVACDRL
jgi:hypothetical protein